MGERVSGAVYWLIGGTLLATLTVTACGADETQSDEPQVKTVQMPDQTEVTCIVYDTGSYAGGLSCDWDYR